MVGSIGPGGAAWAQTPPPSGTTSTPGTTGTPAPTSTPSQEELDAAKQHFDSGVDFFQRGNYPAARAEFEAAYALSKYPQLLYNLGKTAEKLNQTADAIRYLETYLASSPSASDTVEVRAKLVELRKRPDAPPVAPATSPVSEQPQQPQQQSKLPPTPALALMGGGVGLLIIGIGCGAGALADQDTVKNQAMNGIGSDFNGIASRGRALSGAAIAFDVLGGLALAAGGAWTGYWLYQRSKASKQPAPAVALIPMGLGAGIGGTF